MRGVTTPVSAHLEKELRDYTRQHKLVVWLDKARHYTALVDDLAVRHAAGTFPIPVIGLRGSYLETMFELETLFDTVDPVPLILHLPGHNEESVRATPLLELYRPSRRFRKGLDTLVTEAAAGRVRPEAIREFLDSGSIDLATADAWLARQLDQPTGGLADQLAAMTPGAVLDDLLKPGFVARRIDGPADLDALWGWLEVRLGVDARWRERACSGTGPQDVAFVATSWALCVEYVHDLARPPRAGLLRRLPGLPVAVVAACRELADHLRQRHADVYTRCADEVQTWLDDEIRGALPEDLGKIDTFRFEEEVILGAAIEALHTERWEQVRTWARDRLDGRSFWLQEPARRVAWELLLAAVDLGLAIAAAGPVLDAREGHEAALERYAAVGAAVDRAHRQLEQKRTVLLQRNVPCFSQLRERLNYLRLTYRDWADEWALGFSELCGELGFLPPEHLQQRTLFEQVVRPLTRKPGVTALFLVDALRFEMAQDLEAALKGMAATEIHLAARLAELPTITSVGMNVLAPVSTGGRLRPLLKGSIFRGFSAGEFQVTGKDSRQRAMQARVGGSTCPWLEMGEVLSRDADSLRRGIAQASLVVVHSIEIDEAGEKGLGYVVFERALENLRAACGLLREAGVRRFVFTSDHGFALLDEQTRDLVTHGRTNDPKRRYVIYPAAVRPDGQVCVALESLGYEGAPGHLVMPSDTAMYDVGRTAQTFVHGGNSLQERMIPVLTVQHRKQAGPRTTHYALSAEAREGIAGLHCLEGRLEVADQTALAFSATRELDVGLRAADAVDVLVEVFDVRGAARRVGSGVRARVGSSFELFFRLSGPADRRVQAELFHPTGAEEVQAGRTARRFAVAGARIEPAAEVTDRTWLSELPEGGVRRLFEHLAAHGSITEAEATELFGSPRKLRRFSMKFESYAARVPFGVRIEASAGGKRFVREGEGG